MKTFKQVVSTLSVLTFFSLSAFAGGVGNGGVSVVCRNQAGIINSAQVLDIYEGEVRFGRKYDNASDAETKIKLAQLKLVKFPNFLEQFQKELAKVKAIMTFVPKGNRLVPTNDAFPKIEKVGCDFEQLANYTDEAELLVSQEIYDELDELNKAALLVHETVYAILRNKKNVKDSQLARELTAQILAQNADQKVIDAILEDQFGNNRCGEVGSIQERIKNCGFKKSTFVLVTRTKSGQEVYKDMKSGLIWSDRLTTPMTHLDAEQACIDLTIYEVAWRLPSHEEYLKAEMSGIRQALPNIKYWFWTSSLSGINYSSALLFNGDHGYSATEYRDFDKSSVRCVAQ